MKRIALVALLLTAVVAYRAQSPRPAPSGSSATITPAASPSLAGFPAMQAHVDTTTGDFIDSVGFTAEDFPPGLLDSLSTDDTGLVMEAAPGGGMMVRTPGRYHTLFWGGRDSHGKATAVCLSPEELKREVHKP